MARKFTQTIRQAKGYGFEKVGTAYEGTFTSTKIAQITDKDGSRDALLIMLTPDAGEGPDKGQPFGVWANAILADLISQVPTGRYVRIVHTGVGPAKGKHSPAKLFEVQIAD